jgi:hypothetical protein
MESTRAGTPVLEALHRAARARGSAPGRLDAVLDPGQSRCCVTLVPAQGDGTTSTREPMP